MLRFGPCPPSSRPPRALARPPDARPVPGVAARTSDFSAPEPDEDAAGGAATSRRAATRNAFSHPSATLSFAQQLDFRVGDGIFRKLWVSAPSSTASSDGLGPLYNARSCQSCHLKDGRGHPAEGRWPDGGRHVDALSRERASPHGRGAPPRGGGPGHGRPRADLRHAAPGLRDSGALARGPGADHVPGPPGGASRRPGRAPPAAGLPDRGSSGTARSIRRRCSPRELRPR